MDDLESRLASLERTTRRYRVALAVAVIACFAIGATAFDDNIPEVLRTRRLEIVDSTGAILFEASTDTDGGRAIVRKRGGGGGMLFTNTEGGALALINAAGHVPFRAGLSSKGGLLVLTNSEDRLVLVAAADDSANGAIVLYDTTGRESFNAP